MFERMSAGWEMAKESWGVLKKDKELVAFPIISGFSCLLVLGSFLVPLWQAGAFEQINEAPQKFQEPVAWLITFAYYFVNYFVITFFNSALVACAVIRFRGGDPTVADGFRASLNRLPQIASWAFVSATVGVILKAIESRSERGGKIASAILGTGWAIATFLVVPVLVVEGTGPITAVKRSLSILRTTWGEALGANFGIGLISFLATLPAIALIVGGGFVIANNAVLGGILIGLGVIGLIFVSLCSTTLNSVILAALYLFAAEEVVPGGFDPRLLRSAFTS